MKDATTISKHRNWPMVRTPRYLPYNICMLWSYHTNNIWNIFSYWWCDGAGNNRIDKNIYVTQHYTYANKGHIMLRALWYLRKCRGQGPIDHKKGHLGPQTGFHTLANTPDGQWTQSTRYKLYLVWMVIPIYLFWDASSLWVYSRPTKHPKWALLGYFLVCLCASLQCEIPGGLWE
jgi:hypothetical protein